MGGITMIPFYNDMKKVTSKLWDNVGNAWDDFTGKTQIEMQNDYNMKMWKLQNEYNTPANQMKRYRDAGLNPNLIYGNGSSSAGNATSAPEMTAHQGGAGKVLELLSWFVGLKGQLSEQKNEALKTASEIQHSKDALDLQKKRFMVDDAFRNLELRLRQDEFNWRKGSKDRDLTLAERNLRLAEDRFNWERGYVEGHGYKPGSLYGFADRVINSVTGKGITDVGTDTNNLLNNVFSKSALPVYYGQRFYDWTENMVKEVAKDLGKNMSKGRYF